MSHNVEDYHWTAEADLNYHRWVPIVGVLAQDDYGELCVPCLFRPNRWGPLLNLCKPWHWPSYLHSRLTGKIAMVETVR